MVDPPHEAPPQAIPQLNSSERIKRQFGRNVEPLHDPPNNLHPDSTSGVVTPPQQPALTINMSELQQRFRSRMGGPPL